MGMKSLCSTRWGSTLLFFTCILCQEWKITHFSTKIIHWCSRERWHNVQSIDHGGSERLAWFCQFPCHACSWNTDFNDKFLFYMQSWETDDSCMTNTDNSCRQHSPEIQTICTWSKANAINWREIPPFTENICQQCCSSTPQWMTNYLQSSFSQFHVLYSYKGLHAL